MLSLSGNHALREVGVYYWVEMHLKIVWRNESFTSKGLKLLDFPHEKLKTRGSSEHK
jgi:hypothetical protein